MSQSAEYNELLATRWLRPLNERETTRLERLFSEDPALRACWDEEMRLLGGIEHLPDVPVASNFTAQVMDRLAKRLGDDAVAKPGAEQSWLARLGLMPRLGLGFAVVIAVAGAYFQVEQRKSMALVESLAAVEQSGAAPSVEELKHLDEIQMLAQVPTFVDWELIAATD